MHRCMECKCKRKVQVKKAKYMYACVWGKIREETANTHKTRRKHKPMPIAIKEASDNKKTTPNKVVRAKPTHQSKRTKCNNKNKMSRNSKRRVREGTETKKKFSGINSTLTPKVKASNCNETIKNASTRGKPQQQTKQAKMQYTKQGTKTPNRNGKKEHKRKKSLPGSMMTQDQKVKQSTKIKKREKHPRRQNCRSTTHSFARVYTEN